MQKMKSKRWEKTEPLWLSVEITAFVQRNGVVFDHAGVDISSLILPGEDNKPIKTLRQVNPTELITIATQ